MKRETGVLIGPLVFQDMTGSVGQGGFGGESRADVGFVGRVSILGCPSAGE